VIDGVCKKSRSDARIDANTILLGKEASDSMKLLLENVNILLTSEVSANVKTVCLKLLLFLVTASDDIDQNKFLPHVMNTGVFEQLLHVSV